MFFKSILASAILFAAVSAQLIDLELPTNVVVGVQAGDETCPANNGATVDANVFAVVSLVEQVTVSIDDPSPTGPFGLVELNGGDSATINLGATVCLCLQAGVDTSLTQQQIANIDAEATAQVQAYLLADVAGNAAETTLVNNLIANGLTIDVVPMIAATTDCTCPANEIPGCANGMCTCTPCPLAGQVYNASTGKCQLPASQMARSKRSTMDRQSRNLY